jgi:crotonobetainyl-CoA:carnitine CoA-transferase CaiB-like acyl-CoA transferase
VDTVPSATGSVEGGPSCPVLAWAASGAMALTGWPAEPAWPEGDVVATLDAAGRLLSELAARLGHRLEVDTARLLWARTAGRAPGHGGARRGTTSFGGGCRLLHAADGWVALNLSRPDDAGLLPALTAGRVDPADHGGDHEKMWVRVAEETRGRRSTELVAAAQELGLPASALAEEANEDTAPWAIRRLGASGGPPRGRPPLVVDFTSLWAGPLCAHLLGRAGARVVTVEGWGRPDGARQGDPRLYNELHRGHERVVADFTSRDGQRSIQDLVASADVVLEASRPRALAALGLDPVGFVGVRAGRTWLSITGYGRDGAGSGRVAFGDDAAVAGGLVGRDAGGGPVFCADAIADPVTGMTAAVAALASMVSGGGHLVDCSMAAASGFVNQGGGCRAEHRVERHGRGWTAFHDELAVRVAEPWVEDRGPASPSGRRASQGGSVSFAVR